MDLTRNRSEVEICVSLDKKRHDGSAAKWSDLYFLMLTVNRENTTPECR